MKIHHVAIQVRDLERSAAFYTGLLGLPEVRRQAHAIWVDALGTLLMLEKVDGTANASEPWKSERPGLHLLAFSLDDVHARREWQEKLTAAGLAIEGETDFTFYVRDPDGTRLGFSTYPTRSR